MSRDDFENSGTLYTPHVEIGRGNESAPHDRVYVNSSTFKKSLGVLIQRDDARTPRENFYSIYGVVGRNVQSVGGGGYLNIAEAPISRTLMGFLLEKDLKETLPMVWKWFNSRNLENDD